MYLKFWATWCVPCRKQMPHLKSVHESHGDDIAAIAVNLGFNDGTAAADAFREKNDLRMPVVVDDGRLAAAFQVRVTPMHVLIDRHGRIAHVGHSVDAQLERALQRLTEKTSNPASQPRVHVFMTSWCEWCLAESRPAMARECAQVREAITALYRRNKDRARWLAIFGRLWSGD